MEEKKTFEESALRIEEIVRLLERGDVPLDKSLALFEEGARLIKQCSMMLDDAEQVVTNLQKDNTPEPDNFTQQNNSEPAHMESLFNDE
jgi:exodeoxyribonuclease VII small subunit